MPLLTSSSLVGPMTSRRSLHPCVPTGNIARPSPSEMVLSSVEKPSLFLLQKGREYYTNYTSCIKESPNPNCLYMDVSSGLVSTKPLKKLFINVRPAPSSKPEILQYPSLLHQLHSTLWQICASDIFTLEGANYIICGDFYSKMILIQCLPSGQSNTTKVISLLKEMFSENGIPEILCSGNGPQYAGAQFTDFCTSLGIIHETLSPHYPQTNGFAESCVKSVKHALQHAKYSAADPQLALLALQATPIDAKLPSPAELLYQHQLITTIPAKICNTDPAALQVCEQIATCSDTFKSQANKHCESLALLYAGQLVAMYDTLCKILVPTTVVCVLPKNSYQVCSSVGMVYHHMR